MLHAAPASAPVIGIGEAAFHLASLLGIRFSVVTTLSRSIPVIEGNLVRYGLDRRCARVRACELPVLSLEADPAAAERRIGAEIESALQEDGADCIVLGCAGMAALAERLLDPIPGAGGGWRRRRHRPRHDPRPARAQDLEGGRLCRTRGESLFRPVRAFFAKALTGQRLVRAANARIDLRPRTLPKR